MRLWGLGGSDDAPHFLWADSVYTVKNNAEAAGCTRIAVMLGVKNLIFKEMITTTLKADYNGENYTAYEVTSPGWTWINAHQDLFQMSKSKRPTRRSAVDEDIPF